MDYVHPEDQSSVSPQVIDSHRSSRQGSLEKATRLSLARTPFRFIDGLLALLSTEGHKRKALKRNTGHIAQSSTSANSCKRTSSLDRGVPCRFSGALHIGGGASSVS